MFEALAREAAQIARDVSRAAGHFLPNQLPEFYAGIQRDGRNFPVQYLEGNVPEDMGGGLDLHAGTDNARFARPHVACLENRVLAFWGRNFWLRTPKVSHAGSGRPFKKGVSGRPKEVAEVQKLARQYAVAAIERLVYWMNSDNARSSAGRSPVR
jgi:hypothetical protein